MCTLTQSLHGRSSPKRIKDQDPKTTVQIEKIRWERPTSAEN